MLRKNEAQSLEKFGQSFFDSRKKELQKNYPGLTSFIFRRELESYARELFKTQKSPLHQIYASGFSPELDYFFRQFELGVPVEYITHRAYFFRSEFYVNKNVLIPRPETETLVELAVQELKSMSAKYKEPLRLCDVGTGSGAIILSIMREFPGTLTACGTDISREALMVARRNAFRLGFSYNPQDDLHFILCDRLNDITEKQHLIVSNPPYIKTRADRPLVHSQVAKFEPGVALYLEDDIYEEWFRDLFKEALNKLYEEGIFLMEGHEDHLDSLKELALDVGFKQANILQDLTGEKRFLKLVQGSLLGE